MSNNGGSRGGLGEINVEVGGKVSSLGGGVEPSKKPLS